VGNAKRPLQSLSDPKTSACILFIPVSKGFVVTAAVTPLGLKPADGATEGAWPVFDNRFQFPKLW